MTPLQPPSSCRAGRPHAAAAAALFFAAAILCVSPRAHAQDTRAGEIAQQQADKAAALRPYTPSRFEKIMNGLEQGFASPPDGFFPALGSVYPGGGLTLGAGYRNFYGRQAVWDVRGLYSIRNYRLIEVGTRTPWNGAGRWATGIRAGYLEAPQVGYFGQGPDSDAAGRANFNLQQTWVASTVSFDPSEWARLRADVSYEKFTNDAGAGRAPSIETLYDVTTAPGLFADVDYVHTDATAAIDWRPSPGYSRTGGYYGVTLSDFTDLDETFSFRRLQGELIQHLPILNETWVISARGRIETTLDDDDVVPYYLLPSLGSGRTLRGYSTGRFRDRHSLLTSAEFRWIPSRLALDAAIFFDAGKVTRRRADLDFDGLKHNVGFGLRFHGPATTPLRIEVARGSEGWNLIFAGNAAF